MKRGIRLHDVGADGLSAIAARCSECGIEYGQLVLERSIKDFETGRFSKEYAAELKNQLGDMKIAVLGSYINPSSPDDEALSGDIAKFKEKIRYATVLKPIVVGTETGTYKDGMTNSEEAYQRVLSTMREVVSFAEENDVCVGIEGVHAFVINTPQKMKRIVDDLASDNVKVIFDPVNYINAQNYMNQDKIINDTFELLADKICVLHAKDFVVENGELRMAVPGEGMLNFKLIFDNMKKYGLDIPVISEEISEDKAVAAFDRIEN